MNEKQAKALARALGGEEWQRGGGGGIWLVQLRVGAKLVVFSGDRICEYDSEEAFDAGRASKTIDLEDSDAVGRRPLGDRGPEGGGHVRG